MKLGIAIITTIVFFFIVSSCTSQEIPKKENPLLSNVESVRTDCVFSSGACLKIPDFDVVLYRTGWVKVTGTLENVGTRKNDRNPWHAIKAKCKDINNVLTGDGSDTVPILNVGEKALFEIDVFLKGGSGDYCSVAVLY